MSPCRLTPWAAAVLLLAACAEDAPSPPLPPAECNGAAVLCERPYNEVVYLTAHNAMSHMDAFWLAPNQNHGIPQQLTDGVRGISLDFHEDPDDPNEPLLCHGYCAAGSAVLVDELEGIRLFLEEHRNEVVTILYEGGIADEIVAAVFERAGLTEYLHAQPLGEPWPTLAQMIESGRRLVVFSQDRGGGTPWLHRMWEYTWDTPYHYEAVEEFDCSVGRGDPENTIFQINHFLTAPLAAIEFAEVANTYEVLTERVARCEAEVGKLPTFLWVDFYATGDAKRVVDELNGVEVLLADQ